MTGTSITFEKLDAAGETWTDHYVVIQDDTGETVKLIGPIENLADTFSVLRSEFSGGGNFVVRVRGESGCGSSGFSNGVTVNLDAAAGSCLDGVALGNWGIDSGTGDATLRMRAHHTCPAGTVFRAVYAQTYMPGFPALVLEAGLSSPAANIEDTGLTSGLGWDYWFEAHDSGGTPEGDPGMRTTKENWNAYNVAGHAADEASLHVEYLHSDHLGSTRLVTEALGSAVASLKFYPFGHLAEVATPGASDGVRMQFTGHERDASIGLDYMKARYCSSSHSRFASADPLPGSANRPQSWNLYVYALNTPLRLVDPNGADEFPVYLWVSAEVDYDAAIAHAQHSLVIAQRVLFNPAGHTTRLAGSGVAEFVPSTITPEVMAIVNVEFVNELEPNALVVLVGNLADSGDLGVTSMGNWVVGLSINSTFTSLAHEFGHSFGLGHSLDALNLMFKFNHDRFGRSGTALTKKQLRAVIDGIGCSGECPDVDPDPASGFGLLKRDGGKFCFQGISCSSDDD